MRRVKMFLLLIIATIATDSILCGILVVVVIYRCNCTKEAKKGSC